VEHNEPMGGDLDQQRLERELAGIAGPVRYLNETGSTNSDALDWAAEGAPEGALVVAEYQTAGRGRWGRSWESARGSALLFSLILRPGPEAMGLLTTLAGVACAAGIRGVTGLEAGLKWPNDVILRGRKVAGILVETRVAGSAVTGAVVGVGVNVSSRAEDFPPDVGETATSVGAEVDAAGRGEPPERVALLAAILRQLDQRYRTWAPHRLLEEATALSVIFGRRVRVRGPQGDVMEGVARRLTTTGALELEAGGTLAVVESGEVHRLDEP
jgi:BirA family transcriptional regulator, biotin operon repressor / biotin---[acetyl-CoA-carboxylase] ligase